MSTQEYDYIVVGAGAAGCVVAARLLQNNAGSVLVLEAGSKDSSPFHEIPGGVMKVFQQKSWPYMTVPQPNANNRSVLLAQGKVLGGGSSVNGMIYIRGQKADYDDWANVWGCKGWSYQDVLPYFKKAEANESLGNDYHGQHGPLPISDNRYRHPLTMAFIRAGQEMGLTYSTDFNGADQQGIGFYQTNTRNGARASTAQTYLKSVSNNPKLTVLTDALTHKVIIKNKKAVGVIYSINGGEAIQVTAKKEVIISAGAIASPKILLLSGIGPRDHLSSVGIETVADLPVGDNFHDHLHLSLNATIKTPTSLYGEDKGLKPLKHLMQWKWFRTGLLTSNVLEGGAFIDTQKTGRPDIQFHFLPMIDSFDNTPGEKPKADGHGITVKVGHVRPKSRGTIRLKSNNPQDLPLIDPNYLGDPEDLEDQIRAVKTGLQILSCPALKDISIKITEPEEIDVNDRQAMVSYVRRYVKTVYHPAGSCCMGEDPGKSVVDLDLKVHGIDQLRVIDMSVCPQVTSGNTNAVAIMIGERGADLVLGVPRATSSIPVSLTADEPALV